MPKKFIVGIDFGHGETAAWIVPLTEEGGMKPEGESLKLRATNIVNDRVIDSVVYKSENGDFSIIPQTRTNIIGKMKSRVSDLRQKPEKMEAYKAYIRLMVETLIRLNPQLKVDDGDGMPNFYMCMASPTKWNDQDKNEYLQFFNETVASLGVSFEWIINESDAAFFSHSQEEGIKHNEVTLVIDYGSSTVDYTVMYQGKKISKDEWSNGDLGAGSIEKDILNSYRQNDYEGFQSVSAKNRDLLLQTGNQHINIDDVLDYTCRKLKEEGYKEGCDSQNLDYHLYKLTGDPSFKQHRFEYEFSMSEITKSYISNVEQDIRNLRVQIEEVCGKHVERVILSGGACIMLWFRILTREIFPEAQIIEDPSPSYVVARGIALYAAAQKRALDEMLKEIGNVDYSSVYRDADIQATKDAIRDLSKEVVEKVRSKTTCIQMVECFGEYIKGLDNSNPDYSGLVRNKVRETVTQKVRDVAKNAFSRHFNWTLDVEDINVHVTVNCLPWNPVLFNYSVSGREIDIKETGLWSQTIMKAIENIVERNTALFIGVNWNARDRNANERNHIANGIVAEVQKEADWLDQIDYGENNQFLSAQAESIRDQALIYAEKYFYDHQIFRTTFTS